MQGDGVVQRAADGGRLTPGARSPASDMGCSHPKEEEGRPCEGCDDDNMGAPAMVPASLFRAETDIDDRSAAFELPAKRVQLSAGNVCEAFVCAYACAIY